ncbi:hypothetical protein Ptr902_13603 [Pyrenophora tritici-repentis]|nr:hypothetical protein Ptr902_13603 [Pyrenophora tritici-repentis]
MSGLEDLEAQTPAPPPVNARETPAPAPHDSTVDSGVDMGSSSEFDRRTAPDRHLGHGHGGQVPPGNIIGVDIAATQPAFVPPNCTFEIDDVEEDWPYRPDHFDFIHGRDLMTARLDPARKHHPGALSDDDTIPPNSGYVESGRLYFEIAEKMGAPLDAPRAWNAQMKDAGFINVTDEVFKLPMGTWPRSKRLRTIGRLEQIMILEGGFEAYMLRGKFADTLGMRYISCCRINLAQVRGISSDVNGREFEMTASL